jgi:hypothetical protein
MNGPEVIIDITSGPDNLGRYAFFASWPANNIGPACDQVGRRSQAFRTNLDDFVAHCKDQGQDVIINRPHQETPTT